MTHYRWQGPFGYRIALLNRSRFFWSIRWDWGIAEIVAILRARSQLGRPTAYLLQYITTLAGRRRSTAQLLAVYIGGLSLQGVNRRTSAFSGPVACLPSGR